MTTARFSEASCKFPGWQIVVIHADRKEDAQAAIKLARGWVRENGGRSKLDSFTVQPRWSSNLDQFYRAAVIYKAA